MLPQLRLLQRSCCTAREASLAPHLRGRRTGCLQAVGRQRHHRMRETDTALCFDGTCLHSTTCQQSTCVTLRPHITHPSTSHHTSHTSLRGGRARQCRALVVVGLLEGGDDQVLRNAQIREQADSMQQERRTSDAKTTTRSEDHPACGGTSDGSASASQPHTWPGRKQGWPRMCT